MDILAMSLLFFLNMRNGHSNFSPNYNITFKIKSCLDRVEAAKESVSKLPLTAKAIALLSVKTELYTTHFSTKIEGNHLSPDQIEVILKYAGHYSGREKDESEVRGYYSALQEVERLSATGEPVQEMTIKYIHAIITANGATMANGTPYRDGQNCIREGPRKEIVYMPPKAKYLAHLMQEFVGWIRVSSDIPCPIVAAIAAHQLAAIHPFYVGNGKTARLLTGLILKLGGYRLHNLYSLEQYYARTELDLKSYHKAIGSIHMYNYNTAEAAPNITEWVEYFLEGMAITFEKVLRSHGSRRSFQLINSLLPTQCKVLPLFGRLESVTSQQIGDAFGIEKIISDQLCTNWDSNGFLEVTDYSNETTNYVLTKKYRGLSKLRIVYV